MTKGLSTIAQEAQELKATISQLATALTNNEQAHTRLSADMEAAQTKLKALQEASVAAFDELAAIAERREPEAPVASPGFTNGLERVAQAYADDRFNSEPSF